MVVWKIFLFKDIETANNVMEKEVKMFKNVQNAKVKALFKNWFN